MNIQRNSIWNIIEVLVSSAMLFILFRLIVSLLGVESLGVWSLVMATTSLARFADLGINSGLARFVAEARTRDSATTGSDPLAYVETALFANGAIFLAVSGAAYWPATWALSTTLSGAHESTALALLPFALLSFVLINVAGVMGAALLGWGRSDLKSMIMTASSVLQVALSFWLMQRWGLTGLALAQIGQWSFVIVFGWIAVCMVGDAGTERRLPYRITPALLRPLFSFGLRMQSVTLGYLLFDPLVKFILAAVSGPAAVGVFELAARLVGQARQLLASPSQNLLPAYVSALAEGESVSEIYERVCLVTWPAVLAGYVLLFMAMPLISFVWLGSTDPLLQTFVGILSLGWLFNVATIPAFYIGMAKGVMRWNIAGAVVTTVMAGLISWPLGLAFGSLGVVAAAAISIGAGSVPVFWGNAAAVAQINPWPDLRKFPTVWAGFFSRRSAARS